MDISKVFFLNQELIIPDKLVTDTRLREFLAMIEYIELTRGDGLWFFKRCKENYRLRISDEEFETKIETIISNNKIRGLSNVETK